MSELSERLVQAAYEAEGIESLLDYGWTVQAWKAHGGYGGGRGGTGDANSRRERIFFSPHCISDDGGLFNLEAS